MLCVTGNLSRNNNANEDKFVKSMDEQDFDESDSKDINETNTHRVPLYEELLDAFCLFMLVFIFIF